MILPPLAFGGNEQLIQIHEFKSLDANFSQQSLVLLWQFKITYPLTYNHKHMQKHISTHAHTDDLDSDLGLFVSTASQMPAGHHVASAKCHRVRLRRLMMALSLNVIRWINLSSVTIRAALDTLPSALWLLVLCVPFGHWQCTLVLITATTNTTEYR